MSLQGRNAGRRALGRGGASIIALASLVACAAGVNEVSAPAEKPVEPSEPPGSTASPEKSPEPEGFQASEATGEPSAEPVEKKPSLFPQGKFPPTDPGAPHERSNRPGDGEFRAVFEAAPDLELEKRTEGEVHPDFARGVARRLVIHPHEASRFIKLTVVAFDLRELALSHVPGSQDVLDVNHPELTPQAGLVPESSRADLLAVFNGGFQPRHGRWGMLSLGTQLIPPRDDACTVAVLEDGTARIGLWPALKDDSRVKAYRQTPPCLVENGEVHPKLQKGDRKPWAGQQKDRKTRRRSAVGLSEDGRTLFYALGSETEPEVLAAGMRHVGAHAAAQLDINWNWTRLFLFDEKEGEVRPVGALEENMAKDKGEYIYRPGKRGFFYLVRRAPH